MNFDNYQAKARTTAIYPDEAAVTYPFIGLVGEVGEFGNKFKKTIRDEITLDTDDMVSELGDILWYLSNLAHDLGISLQEVAERNLAKLSDRRSRGVLGGSGDNR